MKILFLEIDGILNNNFNCDEFCKLKLADNYVENLKFIFSKIEDAKIVVASHGNHIYSTMVDGKAWLVAFEKATGLSNSVFGQLVVADVADGISKWLAQNGSSCHVESFAILSSNGDSLRKTFPNNVVDCRNSGLTRSKAHEAVWLLSGYGKNMKEDSQDIWYWSDPHFFHKNIIKYCNRPWNHGKDENGEIVATDEDVERMNEALISRFNLVVKPNDIVWCLGDFSFGHRDNIAKIVSKLNGKLRLVKGNHDRHSNKTYLDAGFEWVYDRPILTQGYVLLSHEPLMFLNGNTPFFNIAGHVHDSDAFQTFSRHQCIACVERHNYYPVSWKTIKQKYDELSNG